MQIDCEKRKSDFPQLQTRLRKHSSTVHNPIAERSVRSDRFIPKPTLDKQSSNTDEPRGNYRNSMHVKSDHSHHTEPESKPDSVGHNNCDLTNVMNQSVHQLNNQPDIAMDLEISSEQEHTCQAWWEEDATKCVACLNCGKENAIAEDASRMQCYSCNTKYDYMSFDYCSESSKQKLLIPSSPSSEKAQCNNCHTSFKRMRCCQKFQVVSSNEKMIGRAIFY